MMKSTTPASTSTSTTTTQTTSATLTATTASTSGFTSTTAPGKVFASRQELAMHYKSDWHKYNLKRREAGLEVLHESDFQARLDAAMALRQERIGQEARTGTNHLKEKKERNKNNDKKKKNNNKQNKNKTIIAADSTTTTTTTTTGVTIVSSTLAHDTMKHTAAAATDGVTTAQDRVTNEDSSKDDDDTLMEGTNCSEQHDRGNHVGNDELVTDDSDDATMPPSTIDPCQSLFDAHVSPTIAMNLQYMQLTYGFFLPDQEYLCDVEGLLGYCHEKITLGHECLYCQKIFPPKHSTSLAAKACQQHMISKRHTKLRYERGIDLEEYDPFYDFTQANEEFMKSLSLNPTTTITAGGEQISMEKDKDNTDPQKEENNGTEEDGEWEDVSDDDDEGLYAGYQEEIARFGFDVTPLGELIFPDGRIVGHRGLQRYYKQRLNYSNNNHRTAVVAAKQAAGERLYRGRVYDVGAMDEDQLHHHETSLQMARRTAAAGGGGRIGINSNNWNKTDRNGILVPTKGGGSYGGFTAFSLYRYRAVVKKARREVARGQRIERKEGYRYNTNKMDKKHNRIMNGVSVAHAAR